MLQIDPIQEINLILVLKPAHKLLLLPFWNFAWSLSTFVSSLSAVSEHHEGSCETGQTGCETDLVRPHASTSQPGCINYSLLQQRNVSFIIRRTPAAGQNETNLEEGQKTSAPLIPLPISLGWQSVHKHIHQIFYRPRFRWILIYFFKYVLFFISSKYWSVCKRERKQDEEVVLVSLM